MRQSVRASAPGKLVLTGEYAVLDGAPALAMAVNRQAQVTLTPANQYTVSAPGFLRGPQHFLTAAGGALQWQGADAQTREQLALFEHIAAPLLHAKGHQPFAAELDTRAFFGSGDSKLGLGSSAALATSLTAALRRYLDIPCDSHDHLLADLLLQHRKVQGGRGSGVDLAASVYGGVIEYTLDASGPTARRVTLPHGLHLLCVWSGSATATGTCLSHIADWKLRNPRQSRQILRHLADGATNAAGALGSLSDFLQAVDAYGAALDELGRHAGLDIFSNAHRRIAKIAEGHGAVYKPSGAGGGDVGVAFAADGAGLPELRAALASAGFLCPDVQCSNDGLTIHE